MHCKTFTRTRILYFLLRNWLSVYQLIHSDSPVYRIFHWLHPDLEQRRPWIFKSTKDLKKGELEPAFIYIFQDATISYSVLIFRLCSERKIGVLALQSSCEDSNQSWIVSLTFLAVPRNIRQIRQWTMSTVSFWELAPIAVSAIDFYLATKLICIQL